MNNTITINRHTTYEVPDSKMPAVIELLNAVATGAKNPVIRKKCPYINEPNLVEKRKCCIIQEIK